MRRTPASNTCVVPCHSHYALFIFVEGYFRFYEEDCWPPENRLPLAVDTEVEEQTVPWGGAAASSSSTAGVGASRPSPQEVIYKDRRPDAEQKGVYKGAASAQKPWKGEYSYATQELVDLVTTTNQAYRQDIGDVVWFSYNCSDAGQASHKRKVSFGSQGILFTKESA